MKIEFKQIDKNNVNIVGIEGEKEQLIGRIFTPSGSSEDVKNAIQICGFDEAFDFWGCGLFAEKAHKVLTHFSGVRYIQKKDIQLLFSMNTEKHIADNDILNDCFGCYNSTCTCDNTNIGKVSPFNVKRHDDLKDQLQVLSEKERSKQ